jgi:dTDP-glucose 4,6-dehydratase
LSRIFITGISGVLGSTLATELRLRGNEVFGCDLAHSADPDVTRADITKPRQLVQALDAFGSFDWSMDGLGKYDLLYHFAAEFGRKNGQAYYEDLWNTNCIGTRNVIEACTARQIPMVFASSSEAYGLSEEYNHGQALTEEMLDEYPPNFHNEYALSKYTNERQILLAARNTSLKAIILRFFNVYGPPEKFSPYRSVVCQFAWKMLNNQPITITRNAKRAHLWTGDWAHTVANIAQTDGASKLFSKPNKKWPGAGGTPGVPVFNIGGKDYITIEELFERLYAILPHYDRNTVKYVDEEFANSATKQPDNTLANCLLGHSPMKPFGDGLQDTVQYLRRFIR